MERTYTTVAEPRYVERAKFADNAGEATPEALAEKLEGGVGVIVDLNEENTKVDIHLDMTGSSNGKVLTANAQGGVSWQSPSAPMFDELATDSIVSKTLVGGSAVEFACLNSTDNHWHVANTKVDDTFTIEGELELGSSGDLGTNIRNEMRIALDVPDASGHLGQTLVHHTSGNAWGDYTPVDMGLKAADGSVLNALKFVKCTQAEYTALTTKDANTMYIIVG